MGRDDWEGVDFPSFRRAKQPRREGQRSGCTRPKNVGLLLLWPLWLLPYLAARARMAGDPQAGPFSCRVLAVLFLVGPVLLVSGVHALVY